MSESLFESHDLVFTRDSKTREYVGGGYLLNSELLNCGAPAFMSGGSSGSGSGSGKKRRSMRTKSSPISSNSGDDSDDSKSKFDSESGKAKKVSDLLHKRVLAIPAGIFLIKSATTAKQQPAAAAAAASFSSTYDDTRIRAMFDGSDDNGEDDNSEDDNGNGSNRDNPAVISEDLYSKLFKMLAPNDVDRKRYWVSAATTCRARNGIGKCTQESRHGVLPAPPHANKKTRKNRREKVD